MERDDRHAVAPLQDVDDRHEQGVDAGRQLDRRAVGPDEPRGLADPCRRAFERSYERVEVLGCKCVWPNFYDVTHLASSLA